MINATGTFSSLTKNQKEAIGLLSTGTFLEYFDLMLYVHMAVLLNELFFPKTDPHTTALLSAFAFCSSYVLRPFGAVLFGYIGDKVGRKITVVITTFLMAVACCVMGIIPTYAEIGGIAAWIITTCRIVQGIASMGEMTGAQLYLTETLKPPVRYPAVILMSVTSVLGTVFALLTASLVTLQGINWRYAFWMGAIIALVGSVARTGLRETPDFVDAKLRVRESVERSNINPKLLENNKIWQEKVKFKTILALFLLQCAWPVCSYFSYIYCGNILKNNFGFTASQVIHQNLTISIAHLSLLLLLAYCSYKIYPLKIAKFLLCPFVLVVTIAPYILEHANATYNLFIIRALIVLFAPASFLIIPISFMHLPVFKRFTYASLSFAISHSFFYCLTSFSVVYLVEWFGYWGITVITLPIAISFLWAIIHFEALEKAAGNFPQKQKSLHCEYEVS